MPRMRKGVLWYDASSIVIGVLLETENVQVEAAWLKNKDDCRGSLLASVSYSIALFLTFPHSCISAIKSAIHHFL